MIVNYQEHTELFSTLLPQLEMTTVTFFLYTYTPKFNNIVFYLKRPISAIFPFHVYNDNILSGQRYPTG